MQKYNIISAESKELKSFSELSDDIFEKDFVWLDTLHPTKEDFIFWQKHLSIHALTIEDILLGEAREKCEVHDNYLFISMQIFDEEMFHSKIQNLVEFSYSSVGSSNQKETTTCLYMLIFENFLISFHFDFLPFFGDLFKVRLPYQDSRYPLSGDWMAYLLIDEIVDEYTRQSNLLQSEVDTIEDLTLSLGRFDQTDMLRRIYLAHRRITILARSIQPKMEVVKALIKRPDSYIQSRTSTYLRDVSDHLNSINESTIEFRESLDRSHNNYLGQSDIELAMAGQRMDMTVKKLTVLTFVMGSAVTISTILGMNTRVPFQNYPKDDPWKDLLPFVTMNLIMISISLILYIVGKKNKWL